MDIQTIVKRIQVGDRAAEKELFDRTSRKILSICRRYSRDDSVAKDYFQESYIRMFKNISKYDSSKGSFSSWFSRLTVNKILSLKRKEHLFVSLEKSEIAPNHIVGHEEIENALDPENLLEGIRNLPEGFRTILNLFVYEEKSHKEIATILGIAESTSRSQFYRAKVHLKNYIKKKLVLNEY